MSARAAEKFLAEIKRGDQDDMLNQIAVVVQQRIKRVRILQRQQQESPVIGEFGKTVSEHPGLTAQELAALMGITAARIYQIAYLAEKREYIKPLDKNEYPRRYWPV